MRCPRCGCMDDKVMETRVARDGASIRRRRACASCGRRFTTHEMVVRAEFVVVKRDNTRAEFDVGKIRRGIQRACWKRPIPADQIDEAVHSVMQKIENRPEREITSGEIGGAVMDVLRDLDEVAYVRFASVYRRFRDIDEFVAEIKQMGRDG